MVRSLTCRTAVLFVFALFFAGSVAAQTELLHWQHSSSARDAMMRTLAEEFTADHPDISIDIQVSPLGEYLDKIVVALSAGAGPDTMQIRSTWMPWLIQTGWLQPLSPAVVDHGELRQAFIPAAIEPLQYDADRRPDGRPLLTA